MSVLLVVNTPPYGSEGPYNAFRLADALALRDQHVEVFLMGDAVHAARAGQDPRGAHASLEQMLAALLEKGVDVSCCGTCCATRGLTEGRARRARARGAPSTTSPRRPCAASASSPSEAAVARLPAACLRLQRRVSDELDARRARCARGERALLLLSGGADSMALLSLLRAADRRLELGLSSGRAARGLRAARRRLGPRPAHRGARLRRGRRAAARGAAARRAHRRRLPGARPRAAVRARARAGRRARLRGAGHRPQPRRPGGDGAVPPGQVRVAARSRRHAAAGRRPGAAAARRSGRRRSASTAGWPASSTARTSTNAAPLYARNLLRLEVLPLLEALNPRVAETLAATRRAGRRGGGRARRGDGGGAGARAACRPRPGSSRRLDVAALAAEPRGRARARAARGAARRHGRATRSSSARLVEALLRLAERPDDAGRAAPRPRPRGGARAAARCACAPPPPPHACAPAGVAGADLAAAGDDGVTVAFCGRALAAAPAARRGLRPRGGPRRRGVRRPAGRAAARDPAAPAPRRALRPVRTRRRDHGGPLPRRRARARRAAPARRRARRGRRGGVGRRARRAPRQGCARLPRWPTVVL